MKTKIVSLVFICLLCIGVIAAFGQGKGAIGLGMDAGVQRIYGDRPVENIAPGIGGLFSYRFLPFADLMVNAGYSQLKYAFTTAAGNPGTTTDLFNLDLKSNLDIINKGVVRPYITIGTGLINSTVRNSGFGSNWAAAFFGGGGFKFQVNPKWDLFLGADYRFTTTDKLDNGFDEGKANDGYFNARAGFNYRIKNPESGSPQIIAERVPTYQVGDYETAGNTAGGSTMDMEQYVRLKSRVDKLKMDIDSQEEQIVDMQSGLSQRRRMMAAMESQASLAPQKSISSSSSMSGFNEIYQEALTNYYNKSYEESVSLFRLLLQQYPDHKLAGSCQFWLAQGLYDMQRYSESIDELYKVQSYSNTLKKDDALFLMGKAYINVNMADNARDTFNRLIVDHPDSEFVSEARDYLTKL